MPTRETLGKYELVTPLSVGGMAELYLAFVPGPGGFRKVVALKHVLPDLKNDQRFVERFLDEARLTAGLSHPNIGQVFDLGQEDGEFYLAMEFISGVALHQVLARARSLGEQLPLGFVCRVVRDAALGLHHAHSYRDPAGTAMAVIHRDVKPNNIMVTFDGTVKVIDFGIAKAQGRIARTQKGVVMGTLQYMPLEQLKDGVVDAKSDIFSLGVVLWELLAGRYLYVSTNPHDRLTEKTPDITTIVDVPEDLAGIVNKALATAPSARFASARDMARAIEAAFPSLYDEEQVGSLVSRLFPDTKKAIGALLVLSSRGAVDEVALKAQVKLLRKADRGLTALSSAPVQPPRRLAPSPPPAELLSPGARRWVLGVSLAGVTVLAGGFAFLRQPTKSAQSLEVEAGVSKAARATMLAARAALMAKDPLKAQELVARCRTRKDACAGLEFLELDIKEMLEASRCGTDSDARELVAMAEVKGTAGDRAAARGLLEGCTAGAVLHPLAREALGRLEGEAPLLAPIAGEVDAATEDSAMASAKRLEVAAGAISTCAEPNLDDCFRHAIATFMVVSIPLSHGPAFEQANQALASFRAALERHAPVASVATLAQYARVIVEDLSAPKTRLGQIVQAAEKERYDLDMTIALLDEVTVTDPQNWRAFKVLGAAYAQRVKRQPRRSARWLADLKRGRSALARYLELAPRDEPNRTNAMMLLEQLKSNP